MKLSTKGRYAVMAMVDIALYGKDDPVSSPAIAERQKISQEYLEQLFVKLRKAGLVASSKGPGGGYMLVQPPCEIRISSIILAADESLQVTRCQGDALDGCSHGEKCVTHELWAALGRQIFGFLFMITLEDVIEKRNLALAASVRRAKLSPVQGR